MKQLMKPFSTIKLAQATFLEVITQDTLAGSGDLIPGFKVMATSPNYVAFSFAIGNPTYDQIFHSGYPYNNGVFDSQRYEYNGIYALKHFFRVEAIDGNGNVVATRDPLIYDAGETVAYDYPYPPYHESPSFDGFWISPRWINLTTENSQGAIDGPGGLLQFDSPLPDGSYILRLTLDPLGLYRQGGVIDRPFTIQGIAVNVAPFKTKGNGR